MIDVHPEDQLNIMDGSNTTFTVTASGLALTYQWQKDEADISDSVNTYSGTTTATLTILSATEDDAGEYRVRVSNPAGSVFSSQANLTFGKCGYALYLLL